MTLSSKRSAACIEPSISQEAEAKKRIQMGGTNEPR